MKKILVSGASSGIGRGLVQRLLATQVQVVGVARDHSKFAPQSSDYFPYAIDFADLSGIETKLQTLKQQHDDIDIIVSCCGYGRFGELEQFSARQIQDIMNVNFTSQAILIKTFLPLLKRKCQGKIIVLGSEAALAGAKKGAIYCASKFALRGFCQSLRQECRNAGISVTLINPGLVRTAFYDSLDFAPGEADQHALNVTDVVDSILMVIAAQPNCVVEEINLQPMLSQVQRNKSQAHGKQDA